MKKLISLLLAVIMVLGMSVTTMAASSAGVSVDRWDGWRGNAVTVENPVSGDSTNRGDVVKVDGIATLTPNVNAIANTPIVELTVDIYGTGTVALVNGAGTAAAQLDLSTVDGYDASAWNEVKLLAVTGLKTYKAYVNGTEVVSNGTVEKITTPVKISFKGSNMYVDDITLEEYRKNGAYPASKLSNFYTFDVTNLTLQGEMEKANGKKWSIGVHNYSTPGDTSTAFDSTTTIRNLPDTTSFPSKKNVIQMRKEADGITKANPLTYTDTANPATAVYSMQIRPEETESGEFQISMYDQAGNIFGILNLYQGNLTIVANGYELKNAYVGGEWYDLKIEVNAETQSADIYWAEENTTLKKINEFPVTIGSTDADGFTTCKSMRFNINRSLPACKFYIADFKVDKLGDGVETVTVFEEDFDSATSKFTHANSKTGVADVLDLTSGYTQTTVTSGETARSGVGRLNMSAFSGNMSYVTEEDRSVTDSTVTKNTSIGSEMWISPELNFDGATMIEVTADIYTADISMSSDVAKDAFYLGLSNSAITNTSAAEARMQLQSNTHRVYWQGNTSGGRSVTYGPKWYTVTFKMATTPFYDSGETIGVLQNNTYGKWRSDTITTAQLSALKYLSLSIDRSTGGRLYIDNLKVQATKDFGELDIIDDFYTAEEYYTNAITREELPEIEISSVLFTGDVTYPVDGEVKSVTVKNNDGASLDGSKLYVAVYEGNVMTDCGIAAVSGSEYTATFSGVTTTRESVVKVYLLDGSTLTPLITVKPVTTIFVVGDSLVADYVGLDYENGQSGWGEIENLGAQLNMNGVQIKDYGIGGTSTVDYFSRLAGVDGARFEIPNNDFWGQVKDGDYLLICTATNEEKDGRYSDPYGSETEVGSFRYNLVEKYIKPAIARGVTPILVCSGSIQGDHNTANNRYYCKDSAMRPIEAYVQSMRTLAEEVEGVEIVDLWALWTDELTRLGNTTATEQYYVSTDNTHTNKEGAAKAAGFIGICLEQIDGICDFVK